MYVQETISDSPFYSTTAYSEYSSKFSSQLPPIQSARSSASSIPMLIMTDDGEQDWEVLSEVLIRRALIVSAQQLHFVHSCMKYSFSIRIFFE